MRAQFSRPQSPTRIAQQIKMQPTPAEMTRSQANCVGNSNRPAMRRFLLSSLIAFFLSAPYAFPVDELVPPFGFRWNDSMRRVEDVFHGAKAKITSREKKTNPRSLDSGGPRSSWIEADRLYF